MSSGTQTTVGAMTSSKLRCASIGTPLAARTMPGFSATSTGSSCSGPGWPSTTIGQSRPAHFKRSNMP